MKKYNNISLFEGLNSLRFFAAFFVLMHHSETIRKKNGLENFEWLSLFRNGGNAVTFFFVLSGFLITYLLLKEYNQTGTVSIKKFYFKRVLRIWPLYFLLFIIGTLILPELLSLLKINYEIPYNFGQVWYYFIFFLPGLVTFYFGHHLLEPLWSIGVEEVFYLIWAPIFKFGKRMILPILISIILLKIILIIVVTYFTKNELFAYIVNTFSFEAMAIGGLGAYFIYNRQRPLSNLFIYKKPMQVMIYLVLAIYLTFHINIDHIAWNSVFKIPVASGILIDLIFLYLIIGVALIDNSIIKFRSSVLAYLGEISYGIYMYHMMLIFTIMLFLKNYLLTLELLTGSLVFYSILTVVVILVSTISKFFFENYFLNIKKKLAKKAI